MIEMTMTTCDLCGMDGEEGVKAMGWYEADGGKIYYVCKKHAEDVKDSGKKLHLY